MDQQVLDTQKWLNKTYSGVAGYQPVKENGLTGWPTIYALREGLQHEVGISPVASGFGSATEAGVSKVVGKLKVGYSGNLVRLVQGAFWAKGISPNAFDGKFTTSTENAIKELQSNAGLNASGTMTTELMKALFDMSAFTLVFGGKPNIRAMQQYLNGHYHKYFGILPCDGIYQHIFYNNVCFHRPLNLPKDMFKSQILTHIVPINMYMSPLKLWLVATCL